MASVLRNSATEALAIQQDVAIALITTDQNPSWLKWTTASINKHFNDRAADFPLYIEGDERTQQDEACFAELRVDGPFIRRVSQGYFYIDIEVNVLLQVHTDLQNMYNGTVIAGRFLSAFTRIICVYKLGDTEFDDNSLVGFYRLKRDFRESIDVNDFGLIRPDSRLRHMTIEAHYRWEYTA